MKIKELREQKNISQTELANYLGVVRSTVCQYEKGNRIPDTETLIKLADYFQVSVDYLIEHKENTENEKALGVGRHATYLSEDEWEWLELRSLIIEEQGEQYLKTLQNILSAIPKSSK